MDDRISSIHDALKSLSWIVAELLKCGFCIDYLEDVLNQRLCETETDASDVSIAIAAAQDGLKNIAKRIGVEEFYDRERVQRTFRNQAQRPVADERQSGEVSVSHGQS